METYTTAAARDAIELVVVLGEGENGLIACWKGYYVVDSFTAALPNDHFYLSVSCPSIIPMDISFGLT